MQAEILTLRDPLTATSSGKAFEQATRNTVLHVGKYGALSLAQPSLIGKQGDL